MDHARYLPCLHQLSSSPSLPSASPSQCQTLTPHSPTHVELTVLDPFAWLLSRVLLHSWWPRPVFHVPCFPEIPAAAACWWLECWLRRLPTWGSLAKLLYMARFLQLETGVWETQQWGLLPSNELHLPSVFQQGSEKNILTEAPVSSPGRDSKRRESKKNLCAHLGTLGKATQSPFSQRLQSIPHQSWQIVKEMVSETQNHFRQATPHVGRSTSLWRCREGFRSLIKFLRTRQRQTGSEAEVHDPKGPLSCQPAGAV